MIQKRPFILLLSMILLLQVIVGGTFANSTINSLNKESSSTNVNYSNHDPIRINNQLDLIDQVSKEGWKGEGTLNNPYVIENYSITKSSDSIYPLGIAIFNTTSYIVIQNCIVNFQGKLSDRVGIYIGDSNNIIIRSNILELNRFGIELENTGNVNATNNQLISNNVGIVIGRGTNKTSIKSNVFNKVGDGVWFSHVATNTTILSNDFKCYNYTGIRISFSQKNVLIKDNNFENSQNPISIGNSISKSSIYISNNKGYSPNNTPGFALVIVLMTIVFGTIKKKKNILK